MTTTILWTLILSGLGIFAFSILMFILAARKRRAAKLNLNQGTSQPTPPIEIQSDMDVDLEKESAEVHRSKCERNFVCTLQRPTAEFDYRKLFLINVPSPSRSQTYINRNVYEQIKRFLPAIAPDVSISSYISNILADHLNRHWDEIVAMYDDERAKPL